MIKKNILKYTLLLINICIPNMQHGMSVLPKFHWGLMAGSYAFYAMQFGCYILTKPSVRKKLPKMLRIKNKEIKKAQKNFAEANINFSKHMMELFSSNYRNIFLNKWNSCKERLTPGFVQIAERNLFTLALLPLLPRNSKNILVYS